MILIAGGQFDINVTALFKRLMRRDIPFHHILVGPDLRPELRIDFRTNTFVLNGEAIAPTACFIRHDVFLYKCDDVAKAQASALNWYQAVLGWCLGQPAMHLLNRDSRLRTPNKIQNLLWAQECGLRIPETIITNNFAEFESQSATMILKPVAGGELTVLLGDATCDSETVPSYPRFVQPRLKRPEMRIYRIGSKLFAFALSSPELDYRRTHDVEITSTSVPSGIGEQLILLCDRLELEFAAADFMMDDSDEWRFLEVNSQPMFAAFDQVVEGRLCDAIIDHLSEGAIDRRAPHPVGRASDDKALSSLST